MVTQGKIALAAQDVQLLRAKSRSFASLRMTILDWMGDKKTLAQDDIGLWEVNMRGKAARIRDGF